jgi:hypothetical protein
MNYSYLIIDNHFVTEFQNDKIKLNWSIKSLRKKFIDHVEDSEQNNYDVSLSFYRTKEWVLNNYPEILI